MYKSSSVLDDVENSDKVQENEYLNELLIMIGFISEEGAKKQFNLSSEEYNNPTEDTLEKVRRILIDNESSNKFEINDNGEIVRGPKH